jgi:hypothetical protein
MGVMSVSHVTSVAQTLTLHPPPQSQHRVSVLGMFFTSNPSLLIYIYRIQAFFSERNHPKVRKHAPCKSLPPTSKSLKNIPRHAPRPNGRPAHHSGDQWMSQSSRTVPMTPENKMKKVCLFFFIFSVYTNAPCNTTSLTCSPPHTLLPHTPNHHHPTARPQCVQMRIW